MTALGILGIPCPLCGGPTDIHDSRPVPGGVRRRRRCESIACGGAITTVELAYASALPRHGGAAALVAVERRGIENLQAAISELHAALYSPTVVCETACASPDPSVIPVIE